MSFLLDTDICSAHMRGVGKVTSRFMQYVGQLHMSVITLGELYTWAMRANASPRQLEGLKVVLSDVAVLDFTSTIAEQFGKTHAELLDRGRPVPGMDLLIAATALAHSFTLVTHNTRDFEDVPGLRLADWLDD